MPVLAATAAVLAITFVVPIAVYGAVGRRANLSTPTDLALGPFLATVALEKAGIAVAFTGVLAVAGEPLRDAWAAYAALWFAMFAVIELTELLRRNQGRAEATAGVVSEAVYFPLASLAAVAILG